MSVTINCCLFPIKTQLVQSRIFAIQQGMITFFFCGEKLVFNLSLFEECPTIYDRQVMQSTAKTNDKEPEITELQN